MTNKNQEQSICKPSPWSYKPFPEASVLLIYTSPFVSSGIPACWKGCPRQFIFATLQWLTATHDIWLLGQHRWLLSCTSPQGQFHKLLPQSTQPVHQVVGSRGSPDELRTLSPQEYTECPYRQPVPRKLQHPWSTLVLVDNGVCTTVRAKEWSIY